jgi:hypothetical protein
LPFAGGKSAAKSALKEVTDHPPLVLAAGSILVAFAIAWFAGVVLSFRHAPGLGARSRVLQFFEPGSFQWAAAILVALALWSLSRHFDPTPARRFRVAEALPLGLFLAAAAVVISAAIGVLVELTDFGNGIDEAFSQLIGYVAVIGMGAAAAWWAFKEMTRPHA